MKTRALLEIEELSVKLPAGSDRELAVERISLTLKKNEILCIVGESGSGKSICANAIMGLLPQPYVQPVGGSIWFEGSNLLQLNERQLRALRGSRIGMIFQEPMTALNPLMRIGEQVAEVFDSHNALSKTQRKAKIVEMLDSVGLPEPETIGESYPFHLSGGQRQRVMIAMALALKPAILIADEPTTALDVTTQAQILNLIKQIKKDRHMGVVLITHDFGVVAEVSDRVAVMQLGKIVETGTAAEVLNRPEHPYTCRLISSVPKLKPKPRTPPSGEPILTVDQLEKRFVTSRGLFKKRRYVRAVSQVSFEICRGEVLGLVGESGSGKSTVGRCIVRLLNLNSGHIQFKNLDFTGLHGETLRTHRRHLQMVFQDPYASLNPRRKVGQIIAEGPIAHGESEHNALARAYKLLDLVGLDPSTAERFPHEFSGGQRQRICIARALSLEPELLVADEPVSALDVSVQAQVLELLEDIKNRLDLAMLFITHDLRVAAQICDRVAVMKLGEVVEYGITADVFANPQHTYTKELFAAVPGKTWQIPEIANTQDKSC
jgi:peptide/nickel transport system ATP-binding protein